MPLRDMPRAASGRRAFAGTAVALVALSAVPALTGCGRKQETPVPVSATADTLANGVPRALAAEVAAWVALWRRAAPGFAADSLAREGGEPFTFYGARPGTAQGLDPVRHGASIVVLSPDSTRALDFDGYLEFDRNRTGAIELGREPDSAPTLADFERDTTWVVTFCGTPCFYDGAYWLDVERFALTGATRSGWNADGPWCPFLEIYDLRAWRRARWQGAPVDARAFERFVDASDSALVARIEAALRVAELGRQPDGGAKAF